MAHVSAGWADFSLGLNPTPIIANINSFLGNMRA
jgi:hypothetical protein